MPVCLDDSGRQSRQDSVPRRSLGTSVRNRLRGKLGGIRGSAVGWSKLDRLLERGPGVHAC